MMTQGFTCQHTDFVLDPTDHFVNKARVYLLWALVSLLRLNLKQLTCFAGGGCVWVFIVMSIIQFC